MAAQEIILGTDSGTFWTGGTEAPWIDDPAAARDFVSPREAWDTAVALQTSQAEYLEDSPVELHLRDPDLPQETRPVTSTREADNRPGLRAQWRLGFREALPPDLPFPLAETDNLALHRLEEYLRDTDWVAIRVRQGENQRLDPAFRTAMTALWTRNPDAASALWQTQVPADLSDRLLEQLASEGSRSQDAPETNAIERIRERQPADPLAFRETEGVGVHHGVPDSDPSLPLPDFVRRHFVRTGTRFFYRQTPDRLAFTAQGESFRAEDASVSVATALVELAHAQGWSALRVRGTSEFKRLVWEAASRRGLAVEGYVPSPAELARLETGPETAATPRAAVFTETHLGGRERERPADPLAARVVEIFTTERLAQLGTEDRARFRELYDQAKARLEARGRLDGSRTSGNDRTGDRDRQRVALGR